MALCQNGSRYSNREMAANPYKLGTKAQTRWDSLFRARVVTGMVFVRTLKLASPNEVGANHALSTLPAIIAY